MKAIYLDHGATTPIDDFVFQSMLPFLKEHYGNPSSIHQMGVYAKRSINEARAHVSEVLNCDQKQVVFTSGATESINICLKGVSMHHAHKKKIITSTIEHSASIMTLSHLETLGVEVIYLDVNKEGLIDLDELEKNMGPDVGLVSIIWVNNEIGTIQDIKAISQICRKHKVLLHVDGVAAFGKLEVNLNDLQIDFLSLSAHKFYGPKGAGLLYVRECKEISPCVFGGLQENGLRSGTENMTGSIGLAAAMSLTAKRRTAYVKHLNDLTSALKQALKDVPDIMFNEPHNKDSMIPGLLSISFKGITAHEMAYELDKHQIYVSAGSACHSSHLDKSHVIKAIHKGLYEDYGTIRITFGKENILSDISYIASCMITAYEEII